MRTEIYVIDEDVSVVTNAGNEGDFLEGFTEAVRDLDGTAPLAAILAAGFDIIAKMRGYKSDVRERRTLVSGNWPHPTEKPLAGSGELVDE